MINLKSLEVFFWAAQLSSFSRAAEKLNTTQPAVSQRISALETDLGRQLISRSTKPISLTADGRAAFQHAELILRQISKLESEFAMPHTLSAGMGRIHTTILPLKRPTSRQGRFVRYIADGARLVRTARCGSRWEMYPEISFGK